MREIQPIGVKVEVAHCSTRNMPSGLRTRPVHDLLAVDARWTLDVLKRLDARRLARTTS